MKHGPFVDVYPIRKRYFRHVSLPESITGLLVGRWLAAIICYRKTERSYPYIATINAPVDLLVSMNDYNIAHDVQRFWPLDPTKICFFSSKISCPPVFCFSLRQMRWVDVVEVGRECLVGEHFDWIWLASGQASCKPKNIKSIGCTYHFFAKICMLMHPFASLFDVDDDFQRCFIFTLFLMSFITADAFNCEEFNHCILSPADLTSTWYLAE